MKDAGKVTRKPQGQAELESDTRPRAGLTSTGNHSACKTCHGFNRGADNTTGYNPIWLGRANAGYTGHDDGKCHSPRASRRPQVMVTNYLDTRNITWDDNKTTPNDAGLGVENRAVPLSNATSAQNCHRMRAASYGSATTAGTG